MPRLLLTIPFFSPRFTSYGTGFVCRQVEGELIKPREVFTLCRKNETEEDEIRDKRHLKAKESTEGEAATDGHTLWCFIRRFT